MRDFQPRYRLINGRPFPEHATDRAPTRATRCCCATSTSARGRTRWPCSAPTSSQVARGRARAGASPSARSSPTLDPGSTADTLVTMPSGPETKVTLFEAGAPPRQRRPDRGRPVPGRDRRHDDLPRHERSPSHRRPGRPGRDARRPRPRPSPTGSPRCTVEADLSDAEVRRSERGRRRAHWSTTRHRPPASGSPMTGTFGAPTAHVTGSIPASPGDAGCTPDSGPPPFALSCLAAGKHIDLRARARLRRQLGRRRPPWCSTCPRPVRPPPVARPTRPPPTARRRSRSPRPATTRRPTARSRPPSTSWTRRVTRAPGGR